MQLKQWKTIIQTREYFLLMLLLYKISLDIAFVYCISPLFTYLDMDMQFNVLKYVESIALVILTGLTFDHRNTRCSSFYLMFFIVMLLIPLYTIYAMKDGSRLFVYVMLCSFYIIKFVAQTPFPKLPRLRVQLNGVTLFQIFGFMMTIFIFAWILARGGLRYLNFNLARVYEFRRDAGNALFPGVLSLIFNWYGKIINPALTVLCLWKKKYRTMIFTVICQIMLFGFTAHKSILFFPILIFFVYFMQKKEYITAAMVTGMFAVVVLTFLLWYFTDLLMPISLFVRRVLFVTAYNHFRYYDSFKELGFLFFSDKSWVSAKYPYSLPIQALISQIYYGHTNTWVNTGFLANGYANMGILGMFFYSVIVGILFRMIDQCEKNVPQWVCLGITIVAIYNLLNADLFTAMMTHGILLSICVLILLSFNNQKKEIIDGRDNFERNV